MFIITDATSPLDNIILNGQVLKQSLAVLNNSGDMIGGAINISLPAGDNEQPVRTNDPFINAVWPFFQPIYHLLSTQMHHSLKALCDVYPAFKTALGHGKVGDLNLIARSPQLSTEDTFELVAATAETFIRSGFEYIIISAANQWTGAACEVLGGTSVHFSAYRLEKVVSESAEALNNMPYSKDGFISDKDSGCMLYVLRLQ